jgi:exodeoxyribonuclease VII large subunit
VELGRERLDARARRLPRIEALLSPQAQRLDDLAARLRQGLRDRAGAARETLQRDNVRLSPALLRLRLDRASDRLAATARLMTSLNPDTVLGRGYVRVTDADGRTLTDAAAAGREPSLTLRFRDGPLAVVPLSAAQPRQRPAPSTRRSAASEAQEDLFG